MRLAPVVKQRFFSPLVAGMLLVILTVLITACSDVSTEKLEPTFQLETTQSNDSLVFSITTNLPDETEMLAEFAVDGEDSGGQSKASVKSGKVELGPFSDDGKMFAPGAYVLTLTVPVIEGQPKAVKRRLGPKGENLVGKYVIDDKLGRYLERVWYVNLKPVTTGKK